MALEDEIAELEANPKNVKFARLVAILERYFTSRRGKGSHLIFKTPWQGDPRINLQQGKGGQAKGYQVDQVVAALKRLQQRQQEQADPKD